jgi:hypothetical protein
MIVKTNDKPARVLRLDNGLILEIYDRSNRYYGDYHRVHLEVRSRLPLDPPLFSDEDDPQQACRWARQRFGEELLETRILERMGVQGKEVGEVRDALVESFLTANLPYLRRADYPSRLVARRLAEQPERPQPRLVIR